MFLNGYIINEMIVINKIVLIYYIFDGLGRGEIIMSVLIIVCMLKFKCIG